MSLLVEFRAEGDPVGAARPRATIRGRHASVYMAPAHRTAEHTIMLVAREAWNGRPALDEAIEVRINAVAERPARLRRKKDPTGRLWWMGKPDADNIAKLVLDAAVKAGIMVDDTRVVRLVVTKEYAAIVPPETAHVRVEVHTAPA